MKKDVAWFLLLVLASTLAQAGGPAIPEPDPWSGGIAGSVRGRFNMSNKRPAIQIFFVRVEDDTDVLAANSVIATNLHHGKQAYLLNADAGRYVVVAAVLERVLGTGISGTPNTEQVLVFLDKESIPQTEVEVAEEQMSFLGDILLDLELKIDPSDEAQLHYHWLIDPGPEKTSLLGRSGRHSYRGSLVGIERDAKTETTCWKAAQKVFKKHEVWRKRVQDRMAAVGSGD